MGDVAMRHEATAATAPGRQFWRSVLLAGSFTALPRWTLDPVAGVGEHEAAIPGTDATALLRLAGAQSVPLEAVLLAAHAKVLGALSGEREVTTGYVVEDGSPLPLRMPVAEGSWRGLLLAAARAQAALLSHRSFPVDDLRRELGLDAPLFEVVFDPDPGSGAELADDAVLHVGFVQRQGLALKLRYRTDVLDAPCAARIAGYHLAALSLIAADPDAGHAGQSLLSDEERHFQLHGLAGPRRERPQRRVHELFEEQARRHPDAIAALHGSRQWTYRQLNARANRLARSLRARGLGEEGVVAVATERNLEWMAAVLAIFKAGGAYLPVEPHFPAARIAKMIARSGCRIVLTEPGSTTTLAAALATLPATIQLLCIDVAAAGGDSDADLGIAVAPDQLAYIYFTSGSTGEPKGAMCEHAGMVNHLFAKIEDLEIGENTVVAQTAPQCFDISLWQLLSALLAGGRTLLVEQAEILDPRRFVDTIVGGRVNVVQLVPSYLEVVVSLLEQHPRVLPDLRHVSVTGEALKKELVARWFAVQPGIPLLNAYGLTETSDDTTHERIACVPRGERVPLGRPVPNVHVDVVDENFSFVPLGARGEIVFSGVCAGRGYINDLERTRRAFMVDPHRYGHWLFRSGDHGRWLPDGKLEFLGRRDSQVKISGLRIEIGEIENALLQLPGVRDAAVVVAGEVDRSKRLVAFYCGERPRDAAGLRDRLGALLPAYMVPSALHWQASLPLTDNGKIDRKALTAQAAALVMAEPDRGRPGTATEQRLAAAWAQVLGLPPDRIGPRDHFFELGGTSLSALRLAIKLARVVSLQDFHAHPVLADLAKLIDDRSARP